MNAVIAFLIEQLASATLGSDLFTRVVGVVDRWSEKKISEAEKRQGIINEFEVIGLEILEGEINFAIGLAEKYLKHLT